MRIRNHFQKFLLQVASAILILSTFLCESKAQSSDTEPTAERQNNSIIQESVNRLIELQHEDGAWPYEGVYRVDRKIPVGYRIGGTAIVCTALMYSPTLDENSTISAINKGVELILEELKHPLMQVSTENRYDVRVWGHIYALDLFCRIKHDEKRFEKLKGQTNPWIQKLVDILVEEEIDGGGWNYAGQLRHASFVTAPAVQALLWARTVGAKVPDEIFERSAKVLKASRTEDGAFQYSGTTGRRPALLPGSIARSAACETTLKMLDKGSDKNLSAAIDAFHVHWEELEKRRQKTGTHKPPYGVAPYYFYYGHRYLAQAIEYSPKEHRAEERQRYQKVLLKTRDDDATWNDRVFEQSRSYGTAMAILSLQPNVPMPKSLGHIQPK